MPTPTRSYSRSFAHSLPLAALILLATLAIGCESTRARPEKPLHYIMQEGDGLYINSFSLGQGDFPVMSGPDKLPQPPQFDVFERDEIVAVIAHRFAARGFRPTPDYAFNYGKIHVRLSGYSKRARVGFDWITVDDYEAMQTPANGSQQGRGLYFTRKSPERWSAPELLLMEQLCQEERLYVALINAHQFAWPAGDSDAQAAMRERLLSRVDRYLDWVEMRFAMRRAEAEKRAEQ